MSKWVHHSNCFVARYSVAPDRRADFIAAVQEIFDFAEKIYDEHCNFAFQGWGRDPNQWVAIASWKNEEILGWLRTQEVFMKASVKMLECCDAPMVMENFAGMKKDRSVFDIYPEGKSQVHLPAGALDVVWR
jgi:hypothetical protein